MTTRIKIRAPISQIKNIGLVLLSTFVVITSGCNKVEKVAKEKLVSNETNPEKISAQSNIDKIWPQLKIDVKQNAEDEARVAEILSAMTLKQKVAQMIQPEIRDITVEDMRKYGFGSYLNGGGAFPNNDKHATPADWIKLAEDMYQASIDDSQDGSVIPTMWGTDAVHGHNNVIGATLFPHNIGLGAMNNPELIEKIASITAREVMVTGIDWVFAPTVAVVRDDRWGRTYEGYSEDPEIVRVYAASIVKGLQGSVDEDFLGDQRVISTVKHFLGDGGTEAGDDQGNNLSSEQELFDIHAQGYVGGLTAGAQSVMASFNSWHGRKLHGNKYLLTDVLKDRMGFDGFVVGDWNGHGQVKGCTNESCPQAINAGLDIFMVPTDAWKPLYENTISQVKNGEISQVRIDDAVKRILRVKLRAGIFDKPSPAQRTLSGRTELIGAKEHRSVARQAVRESLVLLKNKNNLLPLMPHQNILVTGDGAHNLGKQSGGWTITWQGTGNNNADFPGGTSIYDGIKDKLKNADGLLELSADGSFTQKPDVAIVVFGEEPYAEGNGDIDNLEYQRGNKKDLALIKQLKAQGIAIVSVFISGRPMWVNAELNASDAFVAAWLPGSEGKGIADVLIRQENGEIDHDFVGRLSYSWPATSNQTNVNRHDDNYQPLFPYGFGLRYEDKDTLGDDLPQEYETSLTQLPVVDLLKAPWRSSFYVNAREELITSNSQASEFVSYRTIDRVVQEDARLVSFNGKGLGHVEINDNFPFDLRGYYQANSSISMVVQIDKALIPEVTQAVSQSVYLSMRCEKNCFADIDISSTLSSLEVGTWQQISVDLACFANKGATMDKIFAPFVIKTKSAITIKYSDVKIIPDSAQQATYSCQNK